MDDQQARELLQAERRRITDELSGLVLEPVDELSSTDLADDASDLYQEEVDVGRIADLREQLAAVERAEERLREGRYGISVESGEPNPGRAARGGADRRADHVQAGRLERGLSNGRRGDPRRRCVQWAWAPSRHGTAAGSPGLAT